MYRKRALVTSLIIFYRIENDNLRIRDFMKSPQITNSRKSKHSKITRSTVYCKSIYR